MFAFSRTRFPEDVRVRGVAPRNILLSSGVFAILCFVFAGYVTLHIPWFGVDLLPAQEGRGLVVAGVDSSSPNRKDIAPGQVWVSLSDEDGRSVALTGVLLTDEPDTLSNVDLRRFIHEQNALAGIVEKSPVITTLQGDRISLRSDFPPLSSLLGNFAVQAGYTLISFFIAIGIWVVRPDQIATRFFALSGLGVMLVGLPLSVYTSRELVIHGQLFQYLSAVNHAGSLIICASLVSLFWVYPRWLSKPSIAVPLLLYATAAGCWVLWIMTLFKAGGEPSVTVYLPILLSYLVGLVFAGIQWYASRNRPTDRAALKWCLLAIFSGTVMLIGLVTIPPVFGFNPIVPVAIGYGGFLMVYLGLAAGLLRYRLFDVERWWFKTWLWFAAGLIVLALDLVLVFFVNMAGSSALAVSLALSGWLYFPLRQILWGKVGQRSDAPQEEALRELVDTLFSAKTERQIIAAWPDLLQHTFKPLQLKSWRGELIEPSVSPDGVRMMVPAFGVDDWPQMLEFPAEGGRLFSLQDLRMIHLLHDLTHNALQGIRAREMGAEVERHRIMRDLHDDLGARLLDLVYASDNPTCRQIALAAIEDLRGLVDATSGDSVELGHLITSCEGEARTRLNEAGFSLHWTVTGELAKTIVSARGVANLMRTLREAITNVIRHAGADNVDVEWQIDGGVIGVTITDNGNAPAPSEWLHGHGTRTINTRTSDLGGTAVWRQNHSQGSQLEIRIPLPI